MAGDGVSPHPQVPLNGGIVMEFLKQSFTTVVALIMLVKGAPLAGDILRLSDQKNVDLYELTSDLKTAKLVFIGESHDQKGHHEAQLIVIRALKEAGVSVAIGMEMFQNESDPVLDRWVSGDLSEKAFRKAYLKNWGLRWDLYSDIFHYARKNKIPMIGLNISRDITQQAARGGFSSLTPEQMGRLPPVQCVVDPAYKELMERAFGAHHHATGSFNNFCEAQLLWDTAMAMHLVDFLKKSPDYVVVVLAGTGHAWKPGIPAQVQRQAQVPYRVILPEAPGRLEPESITTSEADYLWLGLSANQ